jgi:hypothetical protein
MRGVSPRDGTRSTVTSRLPAGAVTPNESLANTEGAGVFFVGSINSLQGGKTVKTVRIPKSKLIFIGLAIVALIGVACVIADVEADPGDKATNATTEAASLDAGIALTEAEVEVVTDAAGRALGEIMHLDHTEGQEAWEARIESLCTPNGLAFWTGPLFADQVWPMIVEREYTTQEVEVSASDVIGEGSTPGSVTVEVTLSLTYTQGESDEPVQETSTNQVVMVLQDGQWFTDGPPPSHRSSNEGE